MSNPKRRPTGKSSAAALAGFAIGRARVALQDPKTKAMVMEQAKVAAAKAKAWQGERSDARGATEGEEPVAGGSVVDRFGQRALERRVDNLRTSIGDLTNAQPGLTAALAPVLVSLDQIASALQVAGGLPVLKRKRAHLRIDSALDELENTLFDAAMPSSQPVADSDEDRGIGDGSSD